MSDYFSNINAYSHPYIPHEAHYGPDNMFAGYSSFEGQSISAPIATTEGECNDLRSAAPIQNHVQHAPTDGVPVNGNERTGHLGQQSVPPTIPADGCDWSDYPSLPPPQHWVPVNAMMGLQTLYSAHFGIDGPETTLSTQLYADHMSRTIQDPHYPHYQSSAVDNASRGIQNVSHFQVGDAANFYPTGVEVPHSAYGADTPQHNGYGTWIGYPASFDYPTHRAIPPPEQAYGGYPTVQSDYVDPSGRIITNTTGINYAEEADASRSDTFQRLPESTWAYTTTTTNDNNNVQMLSLDQHSGSAIALPNTNQGLFEEPPMLDAGIPQPLEGTQEQELEESVGEDDPETHMAPFPCLFVCGKRYTTSQARMRHMATKHRRTKLWLCPGRDLPPLDGMRKCRCPPYGFSRKDNLLKHVKARGPHSFCYREARRLGWDPSVKDSIEVLAVDYPLQR